MMKFLALCALLLALAPPAGAVSTSQSIDITVTPGAGVSNEEFVGPFASWQSVKAAPCSATGNGTTDDTAAIQTCLNLLGPSQPVLYFPAGTYKIVDVATTATASSGASSLTVASATGIKAGVLINGTNIQPGTVVRSTYTPGSTTVPLNLKTLGALSATAVKFSPGIWNNRDIAVVGHDPSDTIIKWAGSTGGTMFGIVGINYSRFNRLTFDGNSTAAIAIEQTFDSCPGCTVPDINIVNGNFDTGNEYADVVFKNAGIGFRCGVYAGCSETTILRDTFNNLTTIGLTVKNFNALGIWVWYSTFLNNNVGIGNVVPDIVWGNPAILNGAGDFHVYNSVFQNSTTLDIGIGNVGVFNIRNNYSIGSRAFVGYGGTGGSNGVMIQGNTILDTTNVQAIEQDDRGPLILLDNVIRSASGATYSPSPCDELGRRAGTCPVVMVGNFNVVYPTGDSDLFSMGNTFTLGTGTCSTSSPAVVNARCHSINDQIVSRATVNPTAPALPGTPPNLGRTIYEASTSGSGTTCSVASPCSVQRAITNAAMGCSNNVAHIQPGNYSIASTITVPADCPIQIIGDGNFSQLVSAGADPIMRLSGPSLATLRNFALLGISEAQDGIEIDNVDAAGLGGMVFVEGGVFAGSNINVFADSIDYANVELHNSQNLYNNSPSDGGITVIGGAHGGQFNQYLGLSASIQGYAYSVSGSANVNINGIWNETPGTLTNLLRATGTGDVTYSGSFFNSPGATPGPTIVNSAELTNFTGTAGLVGLYNQSVCPGEGTCGTWGNYSITGTGTGGNVLGLGLVGSSSTYWQDTSGDRNRFLNSSWFGTSQITEIGTADPTFLTTTLSQMRSNQPSVPGTLVSGQTNVALYRVNVSNANYGLHLVRN